MSVVRFQIVFLIAGFAIGSLALFAEAQPTPGPERIASSPPSARTLTSSSITTGVPPLSLAAAMGVSPSDIVSASMNGSDPAGWAIATASLGSHFPTEGGSFAILSSGCAGYADLPNDDPGLTCELSGIDNSQGQDMTQFALRLRVPNGVNCMGFDFAFLSEEYPEYVGSSYNDTFLSELGPSNFTIDGNEVIAPRNFAFDTAGNVISINTVFGMTENTGTTYDGATPPLRARQTVTPGQIVEIVFTIQDLGDSVFDSTVFLDNFFWSSAIDCSGGSSNTLKLISRDLRVEDALGKEAAPPVFKYPGSYVDFVLTLRNGAATPQTGLEYEIDWTPAEAITGCFPYVTEDSDDYTFEPDSTGVEQLAPVGQPAAVREQAFHCHVSDTAVGDDLSILPVRFTASVIQGSARSEPLTATAYITRAAGAIVLTNRTKLFETYGQTSSGRRDVRRLLSDLYAAVDGSKQVRGVVVYADDDPDDPEHLLRNWNAYLPANYDPGRLNQAATAARAAVWRAFHALGATEISFLGYPIDWWQPNYLLIVGSDDIIPLYRYASPDGNEPLPGIGGPGSVGDALARGFLAIDDYYAASDNDDWIRGQMSLAVGRLIGDGVEKLRRQVFSELARPPIGRVVMASSDGFSVDSPLSDPTPPECARSRGFDVLNDSATDGAVTVDNDSWKKKDFISAANRGVDAILLAGHGGQTYSPGYFWHAIGIDVAGPFATKEYLSFLDIAPSGGDSARLQRIGMDRPFVFLNGCYTGLATHPAESLPYAFMDSGARAFVGSVGFTLLKSFPGLVGPSEKFQDLFFEKLLGGGQPASQSIGKALRQAKLAYIKDSFWDSSDDLKTISEFQLFGMPWASLTYPVAPKVEPSEVPLSAPGFSVDVGSPLPVGDRTFSLPLIVTVSQVEIDHHEGFDLPRIPGALSVNAGTDPMLPMIVALELPKANGLAAEGLNWTRAEAESLGALQVPGLTSVDLPAGLYGKQLSLVPSSGAGEMPSTPVEVIDTGEAVVVRVTPIAHEPATRKTTLYRQWNVDLTYRTQATTAITSVLNPPTVLASSPVAVPVTVAISNLDDEPAGLLVDATIGDKVSSPSALHLAAGARGTVVILWSESLSPGSHPIRVRVYPASGGPSALLDVASSTVAVMSGEIRAFAGPGAVQPGELAVFSLDLANLAPLDSSVDISLAIVDSVGAVIAGVPATELVPANGEATVLLEWNTSGAAIGDYEARVRVSGPDASWGSAAHPFRIGENHPPIADAGADIEFACNALGGAQVQLDGSGSSDPDDDALTYSWTGPFPEGGGTVTGRTVSVTLDVGTSSVSLVVSDGQLESQPDDMWVTVFSQPEICDGLDTDCDGIVDNGYPVGELCEEGVGGCRRSGLTICSGSGSGVECNAVPGPPQPETCDAVDNDCDGAVDEDFLIGVPCISGTGECRREGHTVCSSSGNDVICDAEPGTPSLESCDTLDNDCDGATDEAGAAGCQSYFVDGDADGFGGSGEVACLCQPEAPYLATVGGDCADEDPFVNPGQLEDRAHGDSCFNGKDDNCDGVADNQVQACNSGFGPWTPASGTAIKACGPAPMFSWSSGSFTKTRLRYAGSASALSSSRAVSKATGSSSWTPRSSFWTKKVLPVAGSSGTLYWTVEGVKPTPTDLSEPGVLIIAPPVAATPTYPLEGAVLPRSGPLELRWQPGECNATFQLEFSSSPDFSGSALVPKKPTKATTVRWNKKEVQAAVGPGGIRYWRVVATDAIGRVTRSSSSAIDFR